MNINKIFQSKSFLIISWVIIGLIALLVVFKIGVMVGYKKANFSYRWGENYHRNFAGPQRGFFPDFFREPGNFIESHGTFGQIISVDTNANSIVMKGKDDVERIILVGNDTSIIRFGEKIKISDLKANDFIVVIGEPNENGQIEAKLIRVIPPPQEPLPRTFLK